MSSWVTRRIWRHAHGNINQKLDEMGKKRSFIEFLYKFSSLLWKGSLSQSSLLFYLSVFCLQASHSLYINHLQWINPSFCLHTAFTPHSPPCPLHKPFHPYTHTSKSLHPKPKMSASVSKSSVLIHGTTLMNDELSSWFRQTTMIICL